MICYHTTDAAEEILRHGFRDATGSYLLATLELTGVFLGDSPMDINEGAKGDQVLQVEIPDEALSDYELIEEHKPYREWCVPAALINAHAIVTLLSDDDLERLAEHRWRSQRTPEEIAELQAHPKPVRFIRQADSGPQSDEPGSPV